MNIQYEYNSSGTPVAYVFTTSRDELRCYITLDNNADPILVKSFAVSIADDSCYIQESSNLEKRYVGSYKKLKGCLLKLVDQYKRVLLQCDLQEFIHKKVIEFSMRELKSKDPRYFKAIIYTQNMIELATVPEETIPESSSKLVKQIMDFYTGELVEKFKLALQKYLEISIDIKDLSDVKSWIKENLSIIDYKDTKKYVNEYGVTINVGKVIFVANKLAFVDFMVYYDFVLSFSCAVDTYNLTRSVYINWCNNRLVLQKPKSPYGEHMFDHLAYKNDVSKYKKMERMNNCLDIAFKGNLDELLTFLNNSEDIPLKRFLTQASLPNSTVYCCICGKFKKPNPNLM